MNNFNKILFLLRKEESTGDFWGLNNFIKKTDNHTVKKELAKYE